MERLYYIGLDIHKQIIAYCIKLADGTTVREGVIRATRSSLDEWSATIDSPWIGAMEATLFTDWIYDYLQPYAHELKVAHPEMLKAISASKKKNDRQDAETIANLLRSDLLPECHMPDKNIRELRRILRYRNLLVRESVRLKNKAAGLLMESGAEYSKPRLHGKRYYTNLLENLDDVPESVINLLRLNRGALELFTEAQKQLIKELRSNPLISARVNRLMTIPGVGEITALTWVLEVGDPERFAGVNQAVSYCGLCSAQKESAGKERRGPISKKRNKHLQCMLVEAAKLAPRLNPALAEVHAREVEHGNRNRATLAVARKMVAYMLAVDKRQSDFSPDGVSRAA